MSFVSANVHDENVILAGLRSLNECFYRVEISIHPAGSALVVGRHETVELGSEFGVVGVLAIEELEEVIVGFES